MKKHSKINNLGELQAEIARLKQLKFEQEGYLKDQFTLLNHKLQAPKRIFNAVVSNIPGVDLVQGLLSSSIKPSGLKSGENSSDWMTKIFRVGLPFVMNKFFLKRAGFLKKILVLLLSEQAAGQLNQDKMSGLIGKLTNFIKPKKSKKVKKESSLLTEEKEDEFGIPPYSETY